LGLKADAREPSLLAGLDQRGTGARPRTDVRECPLMQAASDGSCP